MADSRVSKTVEFNYIDNGSERVLKTAQDLQSVFKSLDNLTRNGKLSTYWTDQASLIKRTEKAFEAYNRQATKDNAKELLKTTNALKALSGGMLPETLAGFDKIQSTLMGLKTIELDSMFSVESFQSAFRTMDLMEKAGLDVKEIFSKFMVDTSGFDELNQKLESSEKRASDLRVQLENTQSELRNVKNGTQVGVLEDQIKDLKFDLSTVNSELDEIRENAVETFKAFLKANNLVSKDPWGDDNYDDYSFQKYITQIEEGTMDAQQAIAAFKREWSYLFEGTSSDAFGIEQLQDFSKRLDNVNEKLTSVSIKIDEIRADGVKVNSFEGATSGSDIQEVVNSLERMATTENEVSSSSANMYESLGKIFSSLKELGDIETGNLSNIYGIIRNIGELDDVKINKASLENLANCIERLCNVENTSNLSALYNVDLQKFNDLHISKSSLSNLATYLPEIANINVDDLIKLANIDFTNLNNLDGKSLNALKEFSADLKELIKNDATSTSDKPELDKVATSADEAAKAKQEFVDANEKIQSSVDGSKSKLELETELMERLATAAHAAADAKKEFVEANKQVQDSVDKTAGKTADKTDLSSGGSKTVGNNTNQELKEQENLLDEVIKKGEKARDIISQVGKRELSHVVEKDNAGKIVSEYDQGEYSFTERLQDGQLQRVLVTYNNETKEWEETVLSISTAFEKVGNEVIKLDNQINKLELSRDKTLSQHPGYDTSADDKLIALAEKRRTVLESTLSLYAKEPEYEYESVKFEERRRENNEKILALKEKQANVQQVKSDEATAKAEEKKIQAQTQAAQKSSEAQAKAKAKRQEQLAKAKAAALSKSRQNAKNETQTSVNNAVKKQLESWREIQKIRLQMSKTTDTGELSRLEAMKKVEQERYLAATKILNVNRDLYDYEAQSYKLQKASKDTTNVIARNQKSAVDSMVSDSQKLVNVFSHKNNVHPSDKYVETVKKATNALTEMVNIQKKIENDQNGVATQEQIEDLKKYEEEIKKCKEEISKMPAAEKGSTNEKATKEIKKIYEALEKNSRMSSEAKAQLHGYITELKNNPSANVEEIATAWKKVVIAEKEAGRGGKSLLSAVGEKAFYGLAGQIANMVSLWDVINLGKQAVNQVVELDTALVDLQKTTTMSSSQLNQFYYDANDVAKQMGVTTQEIIEQASAWSRLGYSNAEAATQMAQLSSQFASISPGMETNDAQEGLVSIMKAWDIGVDDVKSEIMDKINILGNTMAESNQDIVEGMERSAAALAAVGTSTEDAFAMFSGINEVLQNAEKSGTALRSISLRLRSFDESTEEYSDDLKNITGELVDLTKTAQHTQGVSVFKDGSTTEFKSLVEYFGEINEIWDEMTQKQQNDFLIKAFGRTQAQAGSALIQNYAGVTKALDEMSNSAGSADKEMETIKSSLEYKLNALKETWVGTAQKMADRSVLGGIIDGLTTISELIGKIGVVPTAITGAGIFGFVKNFR